MEHLEYTDFAIKGRGIGRVDRYTFPPEVLAAIRAGELNEDELIQRAEQGVGDEVYYNGFVENSNLWLTVGCTEILKLALGLSANHFDATYGRIGVGNSATAAAAGQTDLLGTSTYYASLFAASPSTPASGSFTVAAGFGTTVANFTWNEAVFKQNTSAICWNRLVLSASPGTKTTSDYWKLTLTMGVS